MQKFFLVATILLLSIIVVAVQASSQHLFNAQQQHLAQQQHESSSTSTLHKNVEFKPLDPDNTNPSDFYMPVQNPVPEEYCSHPRYPVVPSPGGIAMDILHELYPNGTVPHVPPKPTNNWYKNLFGFDFKSKDWAAVYPYPYIVQPRSSLISLMYGGAPRNETGNRAMQQGFAYPEKVIKGHPKIENASYPYLTMSAGFDFAIQVLNGDKPKVAKVDKMSAEVHYTMGVTKEVVGKLYIVKGSPFVTMDFAGANLKFGQVGVGAPPPIVGMNDLPPGSKVTATQFTFTVAEGPLHPEARKWIAFFSAPVTITLPNPPNQPLVIVGRGRDGSYTGTLKIASGELDDVEASWLRSISHTVAIGASVEYDLDVKNKKNNNNNNKEDHDNATVRFKFDTIGDGPLTMLALPHHLKLLTDSQKKSMNATATKYWCVKGNMTALTGNEWNLKYNLTDVGFGEKLTVKDESEKEMIKKAALFDYKHRIDRCPADGDSFFDNGTAIPGYMNVELYGYVRDLSLMTELSIILHSLGMRSHAVNMTKKVISCISVVMKRPEALPKPCPLPINGTVQCVRDMMDMYYDEKWGGLITGWYDRFAPHYCQCDLPGGAGACVGHNFCDNQLGEDFFSNYGNAFYNDHHFQYGYVLKSLSWAIYYQETLNAPLGMSKQLVKNYTKQALIFARDIANPDETKDKYFTSIRHKDFFDGHSNSEGYDYSGRIVGWMNQQSGGEAVNAYFGVYLLGLAINDSNVENFGRIQLATESFSIHTYQHLVNDTETNADIPTPLINKWGKCLSILFGNGASGATYYGPNPLFQCGITFLPVNSYSSSWLTKEWAKEASEWIRYHDNRTGDCVFFSPLNVSMKDNNPCPGRYENKSFTGNAWSCCSAISYPDNQWRTDPRWIPYLYILDALAGENKKAFKELNYPDGDYTKPTKDLPFPYVDKSGRIVGYEHAISLTEALFFASTKN